MLLKIMHNTWSVIKQIILKILLFPVNLLRGIQHIFKSIKHLLSFSIKSKISFNYVMLYIISCLIIAVSTVGGYGVFLYQEFFHDSQVLTHQIFENNTTPINDNGMLLFDSEVIDTVTSSYNLQSWMDRDIKEYYILDNNYQELYASSSNKKYRNFLGKNIQTLSHIKEIYYNNRFLVRYTYFFNKRTYYIYAFHDIHTDLINLFIMSVCMILGMFIGFLLILFCGSRKSKKVLQPIYAMTDSAKEITFSSLDKRISVSQAQYELKDLAVTLNTMLNRLAYDFARQKQFVSDVSHELRTPIAVIKGYADMLDRWGKEDSEVLEESILALKNEASNMQNLVEKLLFLARHDNKTHQSQKNDFDIIELINEVIKETSLIDNHHELVTLLEDDNISLYGDFAQLKQALRIFVDNAIKYSLPAGKITISANKHQEEVIISIKDEGIGITKEDLPHIFTRFYRSDKSRTKETGGHGLGLAIARVIIANHNGYIRVRSKVGLGTTFSIHLPL